MRVGLDELVLQAQPVAEVDAPGLVGDERIGAAFDAEAVEAIGPDHAAGAVLGFENRQLERSAQAAGSFMDPVRQPPGPTGHRQSR